MAYTALAWRARDGMGAYIVIPCEKSSIKEQMHEKPEKRGRKARAKERSLKRTQLASC